VTSAKRVSEFWEWFEGIYQCFGDRFQNRDLIEELDTRIARLGKFSWELGPGVKDSHNHALVLTPCGNPELLAETRKVIEVAPPCPGWEFYAAKPPKEWQRTFDLIADDGTRLRIDASGARYVLLEYPDGVFDVLLADRGIANLPSDLGQTAIDILLEGELGEERRMQLINIVELFDEFEEDMHHKSRPISSLAGHIQSLIK
jgi:hypothetical protein